MHAGLITLSFSRVRVHMLEMRAQRMFRSRILLCIDICFSFFVTSFPFRIFSVGIKEEDNRYTITIRSCMYIPMITANVLPTGSTILSSLLHTRAKKRAYESREKCRKRDEKKGGRERKKRRRRRKIGGSKAQGKPLSFERTRMGQVCRTKVVCTRENKIFLGHGSEDLSYADIKE